jgi:hypothetical protein
MALKARAVVNPLGVRLPPPETDLLRWSSAAPAVALRAPWGGHTETTISGDTRADWSDAFELVPSLQIAYVWHASKFTREVLDGLLRIGFEHHQQIIWDKGRTVLTRTLYWFQHEPAWFVRKKNAPWYGPSRANRGRNEKGDRKQTAASVHDRGIRFAGKSGPGKQATNTMGRKRPFAKASDDISGRYNE